jgi:hypothetical protein
MRQREGTSLNLPKFPETHREKVCLSDAPKGTGPSIYDLLNDAVSGSDYVASDLRMTDE